MRNGGRNGSKNFFERHFRNGREASFHQLVHYVFAAYDLVYDAERNVPHDFEHGKFLRFLGVRKHVIERMRFFVVFAIEIRGKNGTYAEILDRFKQPRFLGQLVAFEKLHKRVIAEFFLRLGR